MNLKHPPKRIPLTYLWVQQETQTHTDLTRILFVGCNKKPRGDVPSELVNSAGKLGWLNLPAFRFYLSALLS